MTDNFDKFVKSMHRIAMDTVARKASNGLYMFATNKVYQVEILHNHTITPKRDICGACIGWIASRNVGVAFTHIYTFTSDAQCEVCLNIFMGDKG